MLRRLRQQSAPTRLDAGRTTTATTISMRFAVGSVDQYHPIHAFEHADPEVQQLQAQPADVKQFRSMINNPGPMRIAYSADYEDWYYKAYMGSKKFQQKQIGQPQQQATSPGHLSKPQASKKYALGKYFMSKAQQRISQASIRHGMLDVTERKMQFPQIHTDRCSDTHVAELLQQLVLTHATSAVAVWEKALLYRALLLKRDKTYGDSFGYIVQAAKDVPFEAAPPSAATQATVTATATATDGSAKGEEEQGTAAAAAPAATVVAGQQQQPLPLGKAHEDYFRELVEKFDIENGNELHVVAQLHAHKDSDTVLQCDAALRYTKTLPPRPPPASYPSTALEEFFNETTYISLARCLLFGELNTGVSTDPFRKFQKARGLVTRATAADAAAAANQSGESQMSLVIGGFRAGNNLMPLGTLSNIIDERSGSIQKLHNLHAHSDNHFATELRRVREEDSTTQSLQESEVFNPRAVRPEIRASLSDEVYSGLRDYDAARQLTLRPSIDDCTDLYSAKFIDTLPESRPTVPRFLHNLRDNSHVSLLLTIIEEKQDRVALCSLLSDAAAQLYRMSLEYHVPENRHLHWQKAQIALTLVDDFVEAQVKGLKAKDHFHQQQQELEQLQQQEKQREGATAEQPATTATATTSSAVTSTASLYPQLYGLGAYVRLSGRNYSELGFPSQARQDDFNRWMAKPIAAPSVRT